MKLSVLALVFFAFPAWSFRLDPMSAELVLGQKKNYYNFVIENTSDKPLPIQITLMRRQMSEKR